MFRVLRSRFDTEAYRLCQDTTGFIPLRSHWTTNICIKRLC